VPDHEGLGVRVWDLGGHGAREWSQQGHTGEGMGQHRMARGASAASACWIRFNFAADTHADNQINNPSALVIFPPADTHADNHAGHIHCCSLLPNLNPQILTLILKTLTLTQTPQSSGAYTAVPCSLNPNPKP